MSSSLLSQQTAQFVAESHGVIGDYVRCRDAFAQADAARNLYIAGARQLILDGAREIEQGTAECAVLAVIAIHRGDEQAAYALARGCARAAQAAQAAIEELYALM